MLFRSPEQGAAPATPALPYARLPVDPPAYTTALSATLQMKVSSILHKRMLDIAKQRLELETVLHGITRERIGHARALSEFDDLDNILAEDQSARDHARAQNDKRRQFETEMTEIDHRNRLANAELAGLELQIKRKELLRRLNRDEDQPAIDTAVQSDVSAKLDRVRKVFLLKERAKVQNRVDIEADDSIPPADKPAIIDMLNAATEAEYMKLQDIPALTVGGGDPFNQV